MKTNRAQGQALVEYVLVLVMVAGFGGILLRRLPALLGKVEMPLKDAFRRTYKLGDPRACDFDDLGNGCTGTPSRHPRYVIPGSDNFRLFGRRKT